MWVLKVLNDSKNCTCWGTLMYHSVFLHHGDPFCTRVLPCQLHSARRFTSMHVSPSPVPCPRSLVGTHFIVRYRFPLQCHAPRRAAAATVGSTRRSTFPPSPPAPHQHTQDHNRGNVVHSTGRTSQAGSLRRSFSFLRLLQLLICCKMSRTCLKLAFH